MSSKFQLLTILSTFSLLLFTTASNTFAQNVACFHTKIGSAPKDFKMPAECDGGPVVEMAQKIVDKLEKGGNNLYSKMEADVCNGSKCAHKKKGPAKSCNSDVANCYWCTWLVIDAYNMAGKPVGENLSATGLLADMQKLDGFDKAGPKGKDELKKVKPGWVIGFGGSGHIGIVKEISVDDRGNGKIVTLESNSGSKSHTWPIANGEIKKGGGDTEGAKGLPIIGFAGLK